MICFSCQKDNPLGQAHGGNVVGRGDNCLFCGASLRVCKNCQHYDVKAYNECREPSAERVVEKEKSNFCDQFTPSTKGTAADTKPKLDPRAAAEALFKKKE